MQHASLLWRFPAEIWVVPVIFHYAFTRAWTNRFEMLIPFRLIVFILNLSFQEFWSHECIEAPSWYVQIWGATVEQIKRNKIRRHRNKTFKETLIGLQEQCCFETNQNDLIVKYSRILYPGGAFRFNSRITATVKSIDQMPPGFWEETHYLE